jgi:hypothetical protein
MSYPPYRNQHEGSYERGDAERRRRDEERDSRSRDREREPERFRRDHAASFENEDRAFEEASRFPSRDPRFFEDWEQPRRFGSETGWRQGEPERQQSYRRYEQHPRHEFANEWQSQPHRFERFGSGEGGGYYGEAGRFGAERERGERGFAGRGPKNYRRSDQRIQEEVCDRLTSDPQVDASEIQVTVKDGEITLEGTVSERHMKRLAEDCAESVAGVSQVHNRLRVDEGTRQQGKESQSSQSSGRQSSGRSSNL